MRVPRVATWNVERGGLRTGFLGKFIFIGKMGEGKKKPEKECSGRTEENSEGILFKKLREGGIARSR